jgi:hypothetical protein
MGIGDQLTLGSPSLGPDGVRVPRPPLVIGVLDSLIQRVSVGQGPNRPFALKRPAFGGPFLYCYWPSSATELFSMCSRMPGQIEPVFS